MQRNEFPRSKDLFLTATDFIERCYTEIGRTEQISSRIQHIRIEIESTGTYHQLSFELEHGARMAWRNSNRCIGRLFWKALKVRDCRHINTNDGVYEALGSHLRYATNKGTIRPAVSVFAPAHPELPEQAITVANHQLIRYAGWLAEDGGCIGDPKELNFTQFCQSLGWNPTPVHSKFDILPWVWRLPGGEWHLQSPRTEWILEVPLRHPECAEFASLGLRWYAVPVISDMQLEIGGLQYPAAPFNGWYMGTEIGSRNLGDANRYNCLPAVAHLFGLDSRSTASLWKDRSLVELNRAVLHSFESDGVRMVDHHTASEQFMKFMQTEARKGRHVQGDWSWLVPPMSGSASPIFHQNLDNQVISPNFYYRPLLPELSSAF